MSQLENRTAGSSGLCLLALLLACTAASAPAAPRKDHKPQMAYLDNGTIKLGVDLNLGGAVTWLSKSNSDLNLINSWDWGRQVQMSYYSGPVPFTPAGKQPAKQWRGLGWNPIQSGDHFGNASKVLEHKSEGKTLYVKCTPMQWPLDNEPGECTFETWYELDGPAVRVRARLTNARSDKTQYPARGQELPAVYTNGPFYRLMTYRGDRPFTGAEMFHVEHFLGQNGTPWAHWAATENWAALVNDDGWGLGVWNPDCYGFIGGFAGKPGKGGPADDPTGYIAPTRDEILDHDIVHDYHYALILGRLDDIRAWVYGNGKRSPLPAWTFEKDRQGWHFANASDTGWPIRGELNVALEKDDPQLISPTTFWRADAAPVLYLRAAFHTGQKTAQLFFAPFDEGGRMNWAKPIDFAIAGDGDYRTYEVKLAGARGYDGAMIGLRIDPVPAGATGERVRIKSISFSK